MAVPSDNIYVDGLPGDIDEPFIKNIFSAYGTVLSCKPLPGKFPGQKGAALIRWSNIGEAEWVVSNLNANIPEGLLDPVAVRFANPSRKDSGGGSGDGKGGGVWGAADIGKGSSPARSAPYKGGAPAPTKPPAGSEPVSDNIYVDWLPPDVDDQFVREIFGAYGTIASCRALPGKKPGQQGAALIRFSSVEEAEWVVSSLNQNVPDGLLDPVAVRFANNSGSKGGSPGGSAAAAAFNPPEPAWTPPQPVRVAPPGRVAAPSTRAPAGAKPAPPVSDNIYVDGLPADIDEQVVGQIFAQYGTIVSIKAMPGKRAGQKGAAMIRWAAVDEAAWLVNNLNGNVPEGLLDPVQVRYTDRPLGAGSAPSAAPSSAPTLGSGIGASPWGPSEARGAPAARSVPYQSPVAAAPKGSGKGVSDTDVNEVLNILFSSGVPGAVKRADLCLYVSGLPRNTTDFDLYRLFAPFGALAQKGVKAMTHPDGSCTGVGFVDYLDADAFLAAQEVLEGTPLPDGTILSVRPKSAKKGSAVR